MFIPMGGKDRRIENNVSVFRLDPLPPPWCILPFIVNVNLGNK